MLRLDEIDQFPDCLVVVCFSHGETLGIELFEHSFNQNRKQCRDDSFREVDVMGSWCHVIDGYINVSVRLCQRPLLNSNLGELALP